MQSRRFAQAGYAVVQPDLYGCGDSDGDFGEARWHLWLRDIEHVCHWLRGQGYARPYLWGARLGALLALDFACAAAAAPPALILWQPALDGRSYINQFLRVERAARMLAAKATSSDAATDAMAAPLEVAGYALAPQLVEAIAGLEAARLRPPCPVHWLEVDSPAEAMSGVPSRQPPAVATASERQIARWRDTGVPVTARAVAGPSFWASTETISCPALLDATTTLELP
jgi:exosortase A-associated hydrolase 2